MPPKEIKGFGIITVQLPKTHHVGSQSHFIFYKKHTTTAKDKNLIDVASRSLFMVNLPQDFNLSSAKKFFGKIATGAIVETVQANFNRRFSVELDLLQKESFRFPANCGIVSFVDTDALNLAVNSLKKIPKSNSIPLWEPTDVLYGSSRFTQHSRECTLDPLELSNQVARDMEIFASKEQEDLDELEAMRTEVDEDGFTTVVGSHRKTKAGVFGKLDTLSSGENSKADAKMKKKEKPDFYRFQIRDKKKQEMNQLLNKFKQDQERVKLMKEKKRFRPY